jgi:hypothetical protein
VPDYRKVVLDVWIAIEELVSPAEDDNAAKQKDDDGESECDTQRRNAGLLNRRYHKISVRLHAKRVRMISGGCYGASAGFSDATEERIATPSLEVTREKASEGKNRIAVNYGSCRSPRPQPK